MDTVPPIAGDSRTIPKHYDGATEECHAITGIPTDCTAVEEQVGRSRQNANPVVEEAGIGSFEVNPGA